MNTVKKLENKRDTIVLWDVGHTLVFLLLKQKEKKRKLYPSGAVNGCAIRETMRNILWGVEVLLGSSLSPSKVMEKSVRAKESCVCILALHVVGQPFIWDPCLQISRQVWEGVLFRNQPKLWQRVLLWEVRKSQTQYQESGSLLWLYDLSCTMGPSFHICTWEDVIRWLSKHSRTNILWQIRRLKVG